MFAAEPSVISPTQDPATVKRRLAFQKSYSQEHGGSWRRKSLIEDARFETVTNIEFAKRERTLSGRGSISEEEEVFIQNGDTTSPVETEPPRVYVILVTLKEGMATSLSRIIRVFETTKVFLEHIESRKSHKPGAIFDVLIQCVCSRQKVTSLMNTIRQNPSTVEVKVVGNKDTENKDTWFPRHIAELDNCTHLVTKFEPELDCDHPGFTDEEYKKRRKHIADIAFEYKHGHPIPRVEYTEEEVATWRHVYKQLIDLFPTHACREHIEAFKGLEKEGVYSENQIPQLEDVSNFLKRKTGFQLRPVSGLLSARDFLASLAFRVFQCTQYVRHGSKPDHSPEPDCIHELLGHVPMLSVPAFAQFSQEIGLASLGATDQDIEKLATLYWFTVEFGLVRQDGQLRAYGAGTLSSYGELKHALSDSPKQLPFSPAVTSVQEYTDEDFQPVYFYVESFDDMMQKMRDYASTIKRPLDLRYEPFTQSIQVIEQRETLETLSSALRTEVRNLEKLVKRMDLVSV
uniref:Tyrosine 3-monooxygenase-like n=1 Tax=Crassostrea virginica TaxID=6565 RepID=A0A8B8A993_CRAVI|nr:tyrosine 3-monooxygenase-like [Crassostrea virginica]